jgi:uncharacterized LabA/DUF88 family protein
MAERVMIFIDGSNLYHSLKNHFGRTDIDIGRLCQKLVGNNQLIRIYYYNSKVGQKQEPERYKHQEVFFDSVNAVPYTELRLGHLVYNNWPNEPPTEKGVDVQLATDMVTHNFKNNYDVAILVAGDTDYAGAIQAVKDNGKHVEIALFGNEGTSKQLREVADKVININPRLLKDCWTKRSAPEKLPKHGPSTESPSLERPPLERTPRGSPPKRLSSKRRRSRRSAERPSPDMSSQDRPPSDWTSPAQEEPSPERLWPLINNEV